MAGFKPAFEYMLSWEDAARSGEVSKDEDLRTRFGICERFHKNLSNEFWTKPAVAALAWAEAIYRTEYWNGLRLGEIVDQAVASKLFDMCVPMGLKQATLLAQRAAKGLLLGSSKVPAIDGKMGSQTIAAINFCPPAALIEHLCNLSKRFFEDLAAAHPEKQVDLHGWVKRAKSVPPGAAAVGAGA